jgi:PAS domain S-box-containing protein
MAFSLFPNRLLPQVWGQSVGLVAVVLLSVAAFASGDLSHRAIGKLEESAIAFSQTAASSFAKNQQRLGTAEALSLLKDFDAIPGLNFLAVIDSDGRVEGATGKRVPVKGERLSLPPTPLHENEWAQHQKISFLGFLTNSEQHANIMLWKRVPEPSAGRLQWIYLDRDVTDVYRALHRVIAGAVTAILVGIFIIGFLMHRLLRKHIYGIERSVEFSETLGQSNVGAALAQFKQYSAKGTAEVTRLESSLMNASSMIEQQRERVEQSKIYLQNLLDVTISGVVIFDKNLRIVGFNAAAERIFGWQFLEIEGSHLNILGGVDFNEAFTPYFKQFKIDQTGLPMGVPFELKGTHRSGESIDVEVVLTQVLGDEGFRTCASILDITVKKRWMQQLSTQRDRAEAASKSKSQFLANMSHELRTPMNGIMGMTELALETDLTEEQREYLDTVNRCAKQLMTVVNDVLDYSKIEAGKVKIEAIDFSLESLLEDVRRAFVAVAKKKSIALRVELEPELKGAFIGDPNRLRQVLFNLLDNAFKFTVKGEIAIIVTMVAPVVDNTEPTILFEVKDTGIGIPEDKHKAIFELFSQADDSTTRRFGGTGLGLALCKKLAFCMGGDVWLDSKLNVGTSFFFSAKISKALIGMDELNSSTDKQVAIAMATEKYQGKRVLVAEDDSINAAIVVKLLERLNCDVSLAVDGIEAIELATRESFDLVLIDIALPGLSGVEVTKRLREWEKARLEAGVSTRTTHVVSISGSFRVAARDECLMAGSDDYLLKPFTSEQFYSVLKNIGDIKPAARYLGANSKLEIFRADLGSEQLGLDLKTVADLAKLFLQQLPQFRSELSQGAENGDVKQVAHWLHSLAGSLLTLGAHRAGHFAKQLEAAIPKLEQPEMARFVEELLATLADTETEISTFVGSFDDQRQENLAPLEE